MDSSNKKSDVIINENDVTLHAETIEIIGSIKLI